MVRDEFNTIPLTFLPFTIVTLASAFILRAVTFGTVNLKMLSLLSYCSLLNSVQFSRIYTNGRGHGFKLVWSVVPRDIDVRDASREGFAAWRQ
uniref:Uncharacterized protein n=1 Tax=Vespula pensylvanica TaxID=30213 RepID=A0A834U8X3_VESPE|nr:hypothetical protein H0235_009905 [Vespula pensylvanica]